MFKGYIYRLDCPITGEFYIGSRKFEGDPLIDEYMGSYGRWSPIDPSKLIKTILIEDVFDRKSIHIIEGELIKKHIEDPLNMNHQIPNENTFSMRGLKITEETRIKMRNAKLGKTHSKETIKKISDSKKGKSHTEETKLKWSIERKLKNRKNTQETIEKMSNSAKGRIISKEVRDKISNTKKGKPLSEEHKAKLRKPKPDKNNKKLKILQQLKEVINLPILEKDKAAMLNISYPTYIKLKKLSILNHKKI
jgi:hypothetical protein